ncbi:MAG: hypothetical protein WCO26_18690, partial [Deltaproteobacteria bacterium]
VLFTGERSAKDDPLLGTTVIRDCVKGAISTHIRMGGDMTLGKGFMEVGWFPEPSVNGGNK